ncbi:MAG: LptF/LptG family permease, partial [Bdellovibrionales bacterium]|nr:LptF/LptG family permease [Bdellovibrionales bacterium]
NINEKLKINLILEWQRRWSLSATCLIFAFLGVSLGAVTNKRTARSGSLVICISAIVVYWALYVGFESLARAGHLPPSIAAWVANFAFLAFAGYQFRNVVES